MQLLPRQLSTCYTTLRQKALYKLTSQNFVETLETLSAEEFARVLLVPANISKYTLERRRFTLENEEALDVYLWEEELQAEAFVFYELFHLSLGWFDLATTTEEREIDGTHISYEFIVFPQELLDSNVSIGLFHMPEATETQQLSCLDEVLVHGDTVALRRTDHVDLADPEQFAHGSVLDMLLPSGTAAPNIVSDAQALIDDVPANDPFRQFDEVSVAEPYCLFVLSSRDANVAYNLAGNEIDTQDALLRGYVRAKIDELAISSQSQLQRAESYGKYHSLHFTTPNKGNHFYIRALDVNLRSSGVHP